MEYFRFNKSLQKSLIGCVPQSNDMDNSYNFRAKNSISEARIAERLSFKPDLHSIQLKYKAKITDVLNCWQIKNECGLVVNSKFLDILKEFKILEHQVFPANAIKGKKNFEYFLFWGYENNNNFLDFKKSKFYLGSNFSSKKGELEVNSFEELNDLVNKFISENLDKPFKERSRVCIEKIVFEEKKIVLDLFRLDYIYNSFFISERLLNTLLKLNTTGFDYVNVKELKIKVQPYLR